jgi:hypothetical protein
LFSRPVTTFARREGAIAEIACPLDATASASTVSYYTLAFLTLIYALNFVDRTIFNVLIEPIKKEFQLSDTMLGLLAGFGFVLMASAAVARQR